MKTYGIDASALLKKNPTGVEKYVEELLAAMMKLPLQDDERVILYAPAGKPEGFSLPARWSWKELSFFLPKGWTHVRLSGELTLHPPTVFFSPAHEIPFFPGTAKVVSTVHDVAFRRFPESYDAKARARQELSIKRVKRLAKKVLTVSETTRADLLTLFSFDPSRVIVSPLAPAFSHKPTAEQISTVTAGYRLIPQHYLLFVGRVEEKKNVRTLLKSFIHVKGTLGHGHPLKLVLAGSLGYGGEDMKRLAKESAFADDILFLGYVPDAHVPPLMAGARAFVLPSLWEGFGLPILEAMTAGTPVIASDIPVFREIAGEAAILVLAQSVEGFSQAFSTIVFEEAKRAELIAKGAERVKRFSWDTTAALTWEALRSASL
jgi:glycosyltransferase involved in cell wall biosynthesis